jgi:glycyl-tRNA synthetase beta chain
VKTQNFLLEIGCEELPASFIKPALLFLKMEIQKRLESAHIPPSGIETHGTPRRLIVIAYDIPEVQPDREELIIGPSVKAAFDENGNPTKAATGFAKSRGVSVDELVKVTNPRGKKGEYVAVKKTVKGKPAVQILSEILPEVIISIPFKKSMRWGTKKIRFGRPIRWITAVYGKETVPFEINNIKSGNISFGHRFLSPEPFEVENVNEFLDELEKRYVVADTEKRKSIILDSAEGLAKKAGGRLVKDEDLLEEVTNLVEYPYPILGSFEEEFLELPKEVPVVVMKDHQKFFSIVDEKGNLKNYFVGIANIKPVDESTIRLGYEKVLKARLSDALFFFNEDRKKKLEERVTALKGIVFHEKLGTVFDKVTRLEKLAPFVSERLGFKEPQKARRAARLCKADLLTEMVSEFPELQGTMGKYYALLDGENGEIATAIEEHYLPRFSGDRVASTETGIALSIAEKADNLVGFFGVGIKPTGSADPFSLRRNALGIIQTLLTNKLHLNLLPVFRESENAYRGFGIELHEGTAEEVLSFIRERLKVFLKEKGHRADTVEAVLPASDDVYDISLRAEAIDALRNTEEFEDVLITMRRVVNIIPKGFEAKAFEPEGKYEVGLFEKFNEIKDELRNLILTGDYSKALLLIRELKPHVDVLFDNVMVMDRNETVRNRRLSLLKTIADELLKIADFSKIGF